MTTETGIDFDVAYRVDGYAGIAWHVVSYVMERDEDYEWSGIETEDRTRVVCVMVGDDSRFIVDVDDLTPLDDDEWCAGCGQIGCGH